MKTEILQIIPGGRYFVSVSWCDKVDSGEIILPFDLEEHAKACIEALARMGGWKPPAAMAELISLSAQAVEEISEDELERYARKNSNG